MARQRLGGLRTPGLEDVQQPRLAPLNWHASSPI
jgi:hypothetical protein